VANENGFEYGNLFYPWSVSTRGMDLLLIDRISGMNPQAFFELIEDDYDLSRAPVTLTLIATSMRARHPERSLERIVRTVMNLDLEEIEFIGGEDEEEEVTARPLAESGDPSQESPQTSNGSQENGSRTSHETLVSSGHPGSPTGSPVTPGAA
jgi:hypothetical protein